MGYFKPSVSPVMAAPNIIPMADIMLVLLIIFMVVTPMLTNGVPVELAKVTDPIAMPDADKDNAVIVVISRSADIYLGNTRTSLDAVSSLVQDRISGRADKTVFIRSDARAKYGEVVRLVDKIRSAGVDNVGLLTDKIESRIPPPPPV
jgi:biopolymer transport protein ExbD/biopolymer transport protein TolR